jgi:hypothetical protein
LDYIKGRIWCYHIGYEDLGIEFDLDEMEEFGNDVVLLTAEDASVQTYGT